MKKLMILLLALALLAGVFAGCGTGNASQSGTAPTSAPAPTESAEAAEPSPDSEPSDTEPGSVYPLVSEPVTFTYWSKFSPEFPTAIQDFYDYHAISVAEDITGVHIEFVNGGGGDASQQNWSIQIAGGDYCDIQQYVNQYYGEAKAISEDIIIDMAPYLAEYAPNYYALITADDEIYRNAVCDDAGQIGAFYEIKEAASTMMGTVIRQDWLDKLDMEIPETYDELHDVLVAFQTELGVVSPYMLTESGQDFGLIHGYGINGFDMTAITSFHKYMFQVDGEVKMSVQQDSYRDYLRMMSQWYKEGIISSDFVTQTGSPFSPEFTTPVVTGKHGVFHTMGPFISNFVMQANDPEFKLTGVPSMVREKGDITHFKDIAVVGNTGISMSVTTQCSDPTLAIRWCDFWYSEQGIMLYNYGVEGESYTIDSNGNVQLTDLVINNEWNVDPSVAFTAFCLNQFTFASYTPKARTQMFYTEDLIETYDKWSIGDGAYQLPVFSIEDDDYSNKCADLETYVRETVCKFITGEMDVETDWDSFQAQVESMGASYIISTYQEAYNEYLSR